MGHRAGAGTAAWCWLRSLRRVCGKRCAAWSRDGVLGLRQGRSGAWGGPLGGTDGSGEKEGASVVWVRETAMAAEAGRKAGGDTWDDTRADNRGKRVGAAGGPGMCWEAPLAARETQPSSAAAGSPGAAEPGSGGGRQPPSGVGRAARGPHRPGGGAGPLPPRPARLGLPGRAVARLFPSGPAPATGSGSTGSRSDAWDGGSMDPPGAPLRGQLLLAVCWVVAAGMAAGRRRKGREWKGRRGAGLPGGYRAPTAPLPGASVGWRSRGRGAPRCRPEPEPGHSRRSRCGDLPCGGRAVAGAALPARRWA